MGAPYQDGDFTNVDAGFGPPQNVGKVFVLDGANLSLIKVLDDPEFQMIQEQKFGGQFGTSLAAAGDVNGDGIPDILVGTPHHTESSAGPFNIGRAFVMDGRERHGPSYSGSAGHHRARGKRPSRLVGRGSGRHQLRWQA